MHSSGVYILIFLLGDFSDLICDILLFIGVAIAGTGYVLVNLLEKYKENGNEIMVKILTPIVGAYALALVSILFAGTFWDCDWQIEP